MKTTMKFAFLIFTIMMTQVQARSVVRPTIAEGTFELYSEKPNINESCRIYTELRLGDGGMLGKIAKFERRPHPYSPCFTAGIIDPAIRVYKITLDYNASDFFCGAIVYRGQSLDTNRGNVVIRDYRHVSCRKRFPNVIEVEETTSEGVLNLVHKTEWAMID